MTSKKVRDILSSKESFSASQEAKSEEGLRVNRPLAERNKRRIKKSLIFSLFFLILLGIFCYFLLPKAEVAIWPETEIFTLEKELTLDRNVTEIFEKEVSLVDTFKSSGKILKEEKAEGTIKVYNEYSTSPQILIATTRFVSAEGKVFRTPARVTVPGGSYQEGKFIPGEIEIRVAADEPGPEYNIGPTTFSIPGFAGTDRYTKFYAKSFEAMKGGFEEEIARVTEEDLRRAEEILTKEAKRKCGEELKNELELKKPGYLFKDIQTDIIEKFSLTAPEEEVKEFKFQVKASCRTLLLKREYLENYAKGLIVEQISREKNFVEENLRLNYSTENVDLDAGEITIALDILTETYSEVDLACLKKALVGKSLIEAKFFLENQSGIIKTDINFWPFWVRKVPENLNKINLSLRFNSAAF